ncbi:hypothetical protein D9619_000364 [Psilocybe cf. subviscida]|uniref:HTH APSES-type domain-containing protein n=1 Tax=Psilocybe cf. subviscida TaxID=2480587 RepID=A0A8H5F2M5_9AGAR|nr:hypothetical protein D9619_000364 [Psilocybe cf. subviscida]
MPDTQIFKATYSGIPVYEMMCKGVAVMRRRHDSWLNATQILKVAGFDKPQRTRVLEREVQKGEHEKIQGGYGKYQGTWIPLERGLGLAKQYNCEALLKPIIEFQPAAKSPPLAPKHLVANTVARPARKAPVVEVPTPVFNTRSSRRQPPDAAEESDHDTLSARGSEDGSMTPSPSEASSSSRTPSPIRSSENGVTDRHSRRHRHRHSVDIHLADEEEEPKSYADQVLEFFISDTNQVPPLLVNPPSDFDPNMAIDDDGHTPLHWACAMGRIRIVKLLLTAGADIFKVNRAGQTALMRSVMFANNYDVRKFPELYELLHRSTLNIDNYNRTVFHHIVDVAMSKGKTHAARYYMETVLTRLADYPKELADVINFQDEDGETALTMAARCRSKRLVKILIDHGANPKIMNSDGKSTEDYILEDERFRASPVPQTRASAMSFRNAHAAFPPPAATAGYAFAPAHDNKPPLHHSAAGQRASTRGANDAAALMDSLAAAFDAELREKERDTVQAHALLGNIQAEILESARAVNQLRAQAEGLPLGREHLGKLQQELGRKMDRRYKLGWEKWVQEEEARETRIRDAAGGVLMLTPSTALIHIDDAGDGANMSMDVDPSSITASSTSPTAAAALAVAEEREKELRRRGKRKVTVEEDTSDLIALHTDVPTSEDALALECDALRSEIAQYRKRRKVAFNELVTFQTEAGTSGRMGEYRRLIGAGCGGVPPSEVDQVLGMLLETLESEEPSSSLIAWSSANHAKTVPVS